MHKKSTFSQCSRACDRHDLYNLWVQRLGHKLQVTKKKEAEGMIIIQSVSSFKAKLKNEKEEKSTTSLLYDRVRLREVQTVLQTY